MLVLGGGGYHPIALARCWTGLWAILSGRELVDDLPESGRDLLQNVVWDLDDEEAPDYSRQFFHLEDLPRPGPVRQAVTERIDFLLHNHPLFTHRRNAA
jgi:acetoin utilization protein AcuC